MLKRSFVASPFAVAVVLLMLEAVLAARPTSPIDFPRKRVNESLARKALASNKEESANAIAELRSMGPDGLRAYLEANNSEIDAAVKSRIALGKAGSGKQSPRNES